MIAATHGIITAKSTVITTPSTGLVVLNDWVLKNLTIINGNGFRPIGADARAYSPSHIPIGGVGEIRGRSNITIFGLDRQPQLEPYTSFDYCVWRDNQGRVGTYNDNIPYTLDGGIPAGSWERVRTDGTLVHFEYSIDDAVTWLVIMPPVAQYQEILYPKMSTDPGEYIDDILVSGMVSS